MKLSGVFLIILSGLNIYPQAQNLSLPDSIKNVIKHTKDDSILLIAYNDIANYYYNSQPDTTILYGEKALVLSRKIKNISQEAFAYRMIGIAYSMKSEFEKSLKYLEKSIEKYTETNSKNNLAIVYTSIGIVYRKQSDFEKALQYYLKSLQIKEEIKDSSGISTALNNIGIIYKHLDDYDKALQYYFKSLEIKNSINDKISIAPVFGNIGIIYHKQKKYNDAINYLEKSFIIFKEANNKNAMAYVFSILAEIYNETKDYKAALNNNTKSQILFKEMGDFVGMATNNINRGLIYIEIGDFIKAEKHLKDGLKSAIKNGGKDIELKAYLNLSKLDSIRGLYMGAYINYVKYSVLKDSMFNEVKSKILAEMQTKYDSEKKEKENEILRKDVALNEAQLKRRNFISLAIAIVLFLVLIIVWILLQSNRRRKFANVLLNEQKEEILQQNEEIRGQTEELHAVNEHLVELGQFKEGMTGMIVHDLKNPLNTILGLSKKPEVQQAGQSMLNMVLNILDVQKFENAEMKLQTGNYNLMRCINEALQRVHLLLERKSITQEDSISTKIFIKADYEIIVRVFVNILTNAIKYTPNNGKITLLAEEVENPDLIKISITDTGQGIPQDKLHLVFEKFSQVEARKSGGVRSSGLGLTFCKLAIEAHGGEIGVDSEQGKGTTFWFLIPKGQAEESEMIDNKELSESSLNQGNKELKLTSADINYLIPYCLSLKKYSVYEFSDLMEILKKLDTEGNSRLKLWKQQLKNAIRACNEKKYSELINVNRNE